MLNILKKLFTQKHESEETEAPFYYVCGVCDKAKKAKNVFRVRFGMIYSKSLKEVISGYECPECQLERELKYEQEQIDKQNNLKQRYELGE